MFWDWRTGRIKSRLRAHSKVVIAHEWLPHETVCYLAFPCPTTRVNDRTSLVKSCYRILGWAYQALGGFNLLHCLTRDVLANQVVGLTHRYLVLRSCTTPQYVIVDIQPVSAIVQLIRCSWFVLMILAYLHPSLRHAKVVGVVTSFSSSNYPVWAPCAASLSRPFGWVHHDWSPDRSWRPRATDGAVNGGADDLSLIR